MTRIAISLLFTLSVGTALAQETQPATGGGTPAITSPAPSDAAAVEASAPPTAATTGTTAATPAPARNQCADVSCAGHGKCVVKGGEPMCACDNGYIPDPTTGLTCQRNLKAAALAPSKMQAVLQLPQPQRVEDVLRHDLSKEYAAYQSGLQDKNFTEYMYQRFLRKRNAGIGVLVPGLILFCSLPAFVIPAGGIEEQRKQDQLDKLIEENPDADPLELEDQVDENYEPSTAETGLYIGAAVVGVLGMTGTIVGAVLVGKARRHMRHLGRLREAEQLLEPETAVEITPIFFGTADSAQAGVVVEF